MPHRDSNELNRKHLIYDENIHDWLFWEACYEGSSAQSKLDVFKQHERESDDNFKRREERIYGFGYCAAVIDQINFFLFDSEFIRDFDPLLNNIQFQLFLKDADLDGTDYDILMKDNNRDSMIYGHVGILIDKPSGDDDEATATVGAEERLGIYPYCSVYTPPNIWDWQYKRNFTTGRRELTFLKLAEENGDIRIWTKDTFEVWETRDDNNENLPVPTLIDEGTNRLGVIPFVFHYADKSPSQKIIGQSTIREVSKIDVSITENLSGAEEMIDLGAFPMMLMPKKVTAQADTNDDAVGPSAVLPFDKDNPDSKPSWLKSEVASPVEAILKFIGVKADAIYQMTNTGAIFNSQSGNIPSGQAFKFMFAQLESNLSKKADFQVEAETGILFFWNLWQKLEKTAGEAISVSKPTEFGVMDLMDTLNNISTSMSIVNNETYSKEARKRVVGQSLTLAPKLQQQINKEIDDEDAIDTPPDDLDLEAG